MDDVGAAERDVGPLDQIGELALAQSRPQAVAQRHHAAIGQGGADAHPVDFLRRLDLAQPHIAAIEIGDGAEFRRKHRVLLEGHRADDADAAGRARAPLQHRDRGADRRAAAPRDLGRLRDPPRQRHMIDVLHEHRVGSPGVNTPTASAVTGQPVSHCTAEPKRLAPQKTR